MTYRGRYNPGERRQKWMLLMLGLLSLWILASIVVDRSPLGLFGEAWKYIDGKGQDEWLSHRQLLKANHQKDSLILELQQAMERSAQNRGNQQAIVKVESDNLNMRDKPALGSAVIIKLPVGSVVEILYYDQETFRIGGEYGKWCKVRYAGKEGWVWGNYLEIID